MKRVPAALFLLALTAACAPPPPPPAPEPPPPATVVRDSIKVPFGIARDYITRALEQVPENRLSYRATPDVRTFAQLFGHIADSNMMFCGFATGEKTPEGTAEKTATTKAALQKAVTDSFDFCDRAFAGLNDQTGAEAASLPFLPTPSTRLGLLSFSVAHQWEHYGNIVTYLRLNKMVPPSSQPAPAAGN